MKSLFEELFGTLWPFSDGSSYNYASRVSLPMVKKEEADVESDTWSMHFPNVIREDEKDLKVSIKKNIYSEDLYLVNVTCSKENESGYTKYSASRSIPEFVDANSGVAELDDDGLTITFKRKPKAEPEPEKVEEKKAPISINIESEE